MLCAKVKGIPKGADKALDGRKGITALKKKLNTCCQKPYQMVIVDLNMPNLDGIGMM
jgi:CheY-like chemotaxis protein